MSGDGGGREGEGRDKSKEKKIGREENGKGMREGKRKLNKSWHFVQCLLQNCLTIYYLFRKRKKAEYSTCHSISHLFMYRLNTIYYSRCYIKVAFDWIQIWPGSLHSMFDHTMLIGFWVNWNLLSLRFTIGISLEWTKSTRRNTQ